MSLMSRVDFECPACHATRQVELVLSVNSQKDPTFRAQLLDGRLNSVTCGCGKSTSLSTNLLFSDEAAGFLCQVCVGDEAAMRAAEEHFKAAGGTGVQRLVPSRNALVEKVKLLDAGLLDWAVEMTKLLLLASSGERDVNAVLLFDRVDAAKGTLHWVRFDGAGRPLSVASALAAYSRGLEEWAAVAPKPQELRIDRLWARDALERVLQARALRS